MCLTRKFGGKLPREIIGYKVFTLRGDNRLCALHRHYSGTFTYNKSKLNISNYHKTKNPDGGFYVFAKLADAESYCCGNVIYKIKLKKIVNKGYQGYRGIINQYLEITHIHRIVYVGKELEILEKME